MNVIKMYKNNVLIKFKRDELVNLIGAAELGTMLESWCLGMNTAIINTNDINSTTIEWERSVFEIIKLFKKYLSLNKMSWGSAYPELIMLIKHASDKEIQRVGIMSKEIKTNTVEDLWRMRSIIIKKLKKADPLSSLYIQNDY